MTTHTTLSGRELEFDDPTGFIARIETAVADPSVSEDALIDLVYGTENPILEPNIITGRGAVTPKVFADPRYHVLTDLLGRKRVSLGLLDPEKAAAQFTLTVAEAAARIEVHESAVRQAIAAHRLPAWKKGAQWYLDPRSVDAFTPERRGPRSASGG